MRFVILSMCLMAVACTNNEATLPLEPESPGVWVSLGPDEAQIEAIGVSPEDSSLIIAAGKGNIFRSIDEGSTWSRAFVGGPIFQATLVRFGSAPGEIWVGHRDGLLRSTDGGKVWTPDPFPAGSPIDLLVTPDRLYASSFEGLFVREDGSWRELPLAGGQTGRMVGRLASGDGVLWAGTEDGLLESRDGGTSWRQVHVVAPDTISGLEFAPPSTLHAIWATTYRRSSDGRTWSTPRSMEDAPVYRLLNVDGRTLYGNRDFTLVKTSDGGETWEELFFDSGVLRLPAFDPARPSILYGAAFDNAIYRSENGGITWKRVPGTLRGAAVTEIAFDPHKEGTIYALATHLYKSTDAGRTWETVYPIPTPMQAVSRLLVTDDSSVVVHALRSGTPIRSSNGGRTWKEGNAPASGELPSPFVAPDGKTIYNLTGGFLPNGGISRSTDGGRSWTALSEDGPKWHLMFGSDGTLYGVRGGIQTEIVKSPDGGVTWTVVAPVQGHLFDAVVDSQNGDSIWVAALGGVHEIGADGSSVRRSEGLPEFSVLSIAVHPTDGRTRFAAVEGNGIWGTNDGGLNWSPLETATGPRNPTKVRFDPHDPGWLWVMTEAESLYRIRLPE